MQALDQLFLDAVLPPQPWRGLLNRILPPREYQRKLSPYEKRVDFEATRKVFDEDAWDADLKIREQVKKARDGLLKTVKERAESNALTPQWVGTMTVDTPPKIVDILADYLMDVWRKGRDLALKELPKKIDEGLADVKRFAGLEPTKAVEYLRNTRPWLIKGVIDDELKKQARFQLAEHLKGGRSLNETLGNLRDIFEPWVGDPTKITPTGQRGIGFPPGEFAPENVLMAYRVENIIRTESVTAFAQGRVAVGDEAADFVIGYELSAILDSRTCVHPDTLIKLSNGRYRRIEQIRPGDRIISGTGCIRHVIACWRYPAKRWARIKLADEREVVCTLTHQWWTRNGWTETVDLASPETDIGAEPWQGVKLDSVPSMWPEVSPVQQQSAQVLLPSMLPADAESHSSDVRRVRRDVSKAEGRNETEVLHIPLLSEMEEQGCLDESPLRSLREGFQEAGNREPRTLEEILQPSMLPSTEGGPSSEAMSGLQQTIRSTAEQYQPLHRLLVSMFANNEKAWHSRKDDPTQVRRLQKVVKIYSEAEQSQNEEGVLFASLPKTKADESLSDMPQSIRDIEASRGDFLLRSLLSGIQHPDAARGDGGNCFAVDESKLRAAVSSRKVHDRLLSSRFEDSARDGRALLALAPPGGGPTQKHLLIEPRHSAVALPMRESHTAGRRPTATHADHTPEPSAANFIGILMIEEFEEVGWAYDLEIEGDHSYLANGLISHNTEICQAADGIKFPKDHRLAVKLTPALHYQCRTIPVFIVTDDLPVQWSTEAELDRVARLIPTDFK